MDLTPKEQITCPICNHPSFQVVYKLEPWQVVKCEACAFAYINPRLTRSELHQLYTNNYFNNSQVGYMHYTENSELRKLNFSRWLRDAAPFYPTALRSALDIGCAAGYCLDLFREHGWQASGVELDRQYATELRQRGYQVYDQPFLDINFTTTFQLITLFDVVEHLTDLHSHFARFNQVLDKDGIIVFITPDYNSTQRRLLGKKWFQFKPAEHINYFTLRDLRTLANANGFDIVHHEKAGQYSDLEFLEDRLKKYRFGFARPLLRAFMKLTGKAGKPVYVDTASLYVIMKKRDGAARSLQQPL